MNEPSADIKVSNNPAVQQQVKTEIDKIQALLPQIGRREADPFAREIVAKNIRISRLRGSAVKQGEGLAQAETDARVDALTRLPNRRAFDEDINALITSKEPFGVLIIDLDKFKRMNDRYGHPVGDKVLGRVARDLTLSASEDILSQVRSKPERNRPNDMVYRWGGEEFVALIRGEMDIEKLTIVAERIRKAVCLHPHTISLSGEAIEETITVSIGGIIHRENETEEDTMARADKYLFVAKADRNTVSIELPEK
jgi:diguanylate cyclase